MGMGMTKHYERIKESIPVNTRFDYINDAQTHAWFSGQWNGSIVIPPRIAKNVRGCEKRRWPNLQSMHFNNKSWYWVIEENGND